MAKIDHKSESWMGTKNRMGPLSTPNRNYAEASDEQKQKGKTRRKLEDMKDKQDFEEYLKEIWE